MGRMGRRLDGQSDKISPLDPPLDMVLYRIWLFAICTISYDRERIPLTSGCLLMICFIISGGILNLRGNFQLLYPVKHQWWSSKWQLIMFSIFLPNSADNKGQVWLRLLRKGESIADSRYVTLSSFWKLLLDAWQELQLSIILVH